MVEINEKLSGRYKILRPIGQGGMANVFLAQDLILDRQVAVKVLRFDFQDNQNAIRRFQREAMSASQLLHHNIVEVYDVSQENDQQYIVMEYVEGTDLKTYIKEKSPISLELVVNIMSQILSAIRIAHQQNIIHRDIKPQNILITKDNEVKITDFGIAVALTDTSITQTNTLLGSVHYLSPEQARGNAATIKSDIYALGVVLYELITGTVPFDGESAVSIALKHFQESFPRIKDSLDYVPQSLENVVLKATTKLQADRYESVDEMLQDLRTSLSASRMKEVLFVPASQNEKTLVLKPIKPLINKNKSHPHQEKKKQKKVDEEIVVYDELPPLVKPRRSNRILKLLFLILSLLTLALAGYWAFNQVILQATVPDMENMTQAEAEQALKDVKLTLGEVKHVWDESIEKDKVVKSEPKVGNKIDKGKKVDLYISDGKQLVKLENYVGEDYEKIRRSLMSYGKTDANGKNIDTFIVERRDFWTNDPDQVGKILDQSIEPGTQVIPSETQITFTVGVASDNVQMQDFSNLPLKMVYTFAEAYGLSVSESYTNDDYIPEGQVISQSPASGVELSPGDTIEVVVSSGPSEESITTTKIPTYIEYVPRYAENDPNQNKPLSNVIQIFIGDANNNINEVAEEFEITQSQNLEITLYIKTNSVGQYRIVRDGQVIEERNDVQPGE